LNKSERQFFVLPIPLFTLYHWHLICRPRQISCPPQLCSVRKN